MLNTFSGVGNVGKDPDVRYFDSGKVKAALNLAIERDFKREGEPDTDWFRVEVWGKPAEFVANYVKKGYKLAISGRLQTKTWNDKNTGERKTIVIIVAEKVNNLTSKREAEA